MAVSEYAKGVWDDYIATSSAGRWITGQPTDTVGIGLKVTPGLSSPTASVISDLPALNQAPRSAMVLDPTDGQTKIIFNDRTSVDPDVSPGANTYKVQDGDSLWKIAVTNGWDVDQLKALNPQIANPNFIRIDQRINTPAPVATTSHFDLVTTPTQSMQLTQPTDPTSSISFDNRTLVNHGTYDILGLGNVNTAQGNTAYANDMLSDAFRSGNQSINTQILGSQLAETFRTNPDLINSVVWNTDVKAAAINYLHSGVTNAIPTDPLVLDLNGDGVKLTSFGDVPVLFDIDHDGGSKELTGWVSKQDGIVVMDLNGNGKIDGIHEMMSEYFNGAVGTGGESGEKRYAHGFAALKSLDSNNDNAFTSADTAWNNVKVWVDGNQNAVTDAGELKSLAELGISRIDLNPTLQSGLVNGGNEVLATGSFVQSGQTKAAQAVRFIAEATGYASVASGSGRTITAQDGQSTYVSTFASGEAINVTTKGVKNAYGHTGNDTLTGNAEANWLAGGAGADRFSAGAGDDVLIIDADDRQQDIQAGEGLDMAVVVGNRGVTLNLAQAGLEIAMGGTGNDVLIGGGRESVFIRSGDGDDIVIGGAANDALVGENGDDLIDGGAGNDVIRGGRGRDQLLGGAGDDVIEGGLDDDRLEGGAGNDVLKGGQGDDALNGGDGIDVAEFSGSIADYRITRLSDKTWRVVDSKSGRDGADTLTHIEKLSFADVDSVDLTLDNPFPVKDVLTIDNRTGIKLIKVADLLANDRDWQGDALQLTRISDVRGGTIVGSYNATTQEWTPALTASGEIQFAPDAAFTGVMSFKYKIADADGTPGATASASGTTIADEMRGQVFIKTPEMPADALFADQWYLNAINVLPVWRDAYGQGYTGKGVKIAQFEPGGPYSVGPEVFDYRHPDLQPNVDRDWLSDPASEVPQTFSNHATLVAGVMVAARDGQGAVGVAYDAKLSGHYIQGEGLEFSGLEQEITETLAKLKNYDVVNNSWGASENFMLGVVPVGALQEGIGAAVDLGRDGLGTIVVMAGGNDRQIGGNTNTNALTANRAVIVAGAINAASDISTLTVTDAPFSNPGASILVSAPGSNVSSTGRTLTNGDGTVFGSETEAAQGTSFATPIVSGVTALMLEANPNLGWRDVQQILALTARRVNDPSATWAWNGANNWNGGGMHVSHDYGFGEVDARAAVRLAETWIGGNHTSYNERTLGSGEGSLAAGSNLGIALNSNTITRTLAIGAGLRTEHATVSLDLTHSHWGDLTVELISPSGTVSKLVANPGTHSGNAGGDVGRGNLTFALNTALTRGENAQGNWQLRVTDRSGRGTGTLHGWKLDVYGSDFSETFVSRDTVFTEAPVISATADNSYYFTDEFATAPGTNRNAINDTNGGIDIVNAAAVSTGSTINLNNGTTSTVAGRTLTINGDVEFAFGGDGNDTLTGNAVANRLHAGRGNDNLNGGGGLDLMDGGAGNDTMAGGADRDYFLIRLQAGASDTITDFGINEGGEKILLVGFDHLQDFGQITKTQEGSHLRLGLGNNQSILLHNVAASQFTEQSVSFLSNEQQLDRYQAYLGNSTYIGTTGVDDINLPSGPDGINFFGRDGNDLADADTGDDLLDGGNGNDLLWGEFNQEHTGNDWIEGGAGVDTLLGGGGNDAIFGGSGNDQIDGEAGDDYVDGGSGDDLVIGGAGNDVVIGGAGRDLLRGGAGEDILYLEGDLGEVVISGSNATLNYGAMGEDGNDTFSVLPSAIGSGGISMTFTDAGTAISTGNMIGDFDVANEKIDLSQFSAIRGINDLTFSQSSYSGIPITRIHIGTGASAITVSVFNVSSASLTAANFIFAERSDLPGGTNGNDVLVGQAGADWIDGGLGTDRMEGRTGDDTYVVDNSGDTVIELPDGGFDTIRSSISYTLPANVENIVLTGSGPVNGTGNEQANRIIGNAANNVLDGAAGVDTLVGGAGNDTYVVDHLSDSVVELANEGTDTVRASVSHTLGDHVENLTLIGTSAINATGNALANTLVGNAADNILDGAGGADAMAGGAGNDTYLVDHAGDVLIENTDEGIDTVYASINSTLGANIENLTLAHGAITGTGNALFNLLIGNAANNTLLGGAGNDTLDGGAGNDILVGGVGSDTYVVDSVTDVVTENATEGTDTVQSNFSYTLGVNVENLALTGAAAINGTGNGLNNVITGNAGNNVLNGGAGSDVLFGGGGVDAMAGGADDDYYFVDSASDVVIENASQGRDTVEAGFSYTLGANIEDLQLAYGAGAINGTGNALNNRLVGNESVNVLTGGAGIDTLVGGSGNDVYNVENIADSVVEEAGGGFDEVYSSVSFTIGDNIEYAALTGNATANLTGGNNGVQLWGNAGSNLIKGGTGADELSGNFGGIDTLQGGLGDDTYFILNASDTVAESTGEGFDSLLVMTNGYRMPDHVESMELLSSISTGYGNNADNGLFGNGAANRLYGEGGDDFIMGFGGNDTIDGGKGDDQLSGSLGNDSYVYRVGDGYDEISNYDPTGYDTLLLQGVNESQVWFKRESSHLRVSVIGQEGEVFLSNWGRGSSYQMDAFKLDNGKVLTADKVGNLVNAMAGFTPPAMGQTTLPANYQSALNGVIASSWA